MSAFDGYTRRPRGARRKCGRCGKETGGQIDLRLFDRRGEKAASLDSRSRALCPDCAVRVFNEYIRAREEYDRASTPLERAEKPLRPLVIVAARVMPSARTGVPARAIGQWVLQVEKKGGRDA